MFSLTVCLVSFQVCRGADPKRSVFVCCYPISWLPAGILCGWMKSSCERRSLVLPQHLQKPKSTCTLVSRILQRFIWTEIFSSSLPTTSANLRPWFTRCAQNQLVLSLLLKDLVQRLHKLTIEVLSECIRGLPSNEPGAGTRVVSPDVCDENGVRIHVSEYNSKLKKGAIIELEVILTL